MAALPRSNYFRSAKYWLPVFVVMASIFYSSSVPAKDIPPLFPYQDILYHAAIYVILALFYLRALKNTLGPRSLARLVLYTAAFGLIYGASDEFHQVFTPGRSCAFFDLIIDTAGSLIGAAAGGIYLKWRS